MRACGILLPISALPGEYGIGSLGKHAYDFIDFLKNAGQRYWQILPIGPTGYGDSPYQSFSAFAANPYFIDIDTLVQEGLLTKKDAAAAKYKGNAEYVNYEWVFNSRFKVLKIAANNFDFNNADYRSFCADQRYWLDDYALFMAIKGENNGISFTLWNKELRTREKSAILSAAKRLKPEIDFWCFLQYEFYKQWTKLKDYANKCNVGIIGDIPIYVSPDSAEFWANPELFQTTDEGLPTGVAGCPPDAFSSTGQLWGNPLYDWEYHKNSNYEWWLKRLQHAGVVYDVVRIDHFRGFEAYYSIPYGAKDATVGVWKKGPDKHFIKAIHKALPKLNVIAEDLGYLTKEVRSLLKMSKYPGMKVLQFAFDSSGNSDYLPHNYSENSFVYTGTHDNNTTAAWQNDAKRKDVQFARKYLNAPKGNLCSAITRAALSSVAKTAIIPMADWLCLGEEARINTPSTLGGNWEWRIAEKSINLNLAHEILSLTSLFGRL